MAPEILAAMAGRTGARNWLETNAHKGSRNCADHFASFECMEQRFRLFVDSGAFTVWCKGSKGKAIDHDAYIAYAKEDRKSTRLNSSHRCISYAVFCLKKKK